MSVPPVPQDVPEAKPGGRALRAFLNALRDKVNAGGAGTVTEIDTALPITGGPITASGTIAINAFTGDSGSGGAKGAVPAPATGDAALRRMLGAGGSWVDRYTQHTYTYASALTVDAGAYDVVDVTLTGAITITLSNGMDGKPIVLRLRQDATGGRTVAFDSSVRFSVDLPSFTASTNPSYVDWLLFRYISADSKYDLLAYNRGFH